MSQQLVGVEPRDDISVIRMQRPPVNAMDVAFRRALDAALDRVQQLGAGEAELRIGARRRLALIGNTVSNDDPVLPTWDAADLALATKRG